MLLNTGQVLAHYTENYTLPLRKNNQEEHPRCSHTLASTIQLRSQTNRQAQMDAELVQQLQAQIQAMQQQLQAMQQAQAAPPAAAPAGIQLVVPPRCGFKRSKLNTLPSC